ncbi:MAG: B12-binding domain-containing radical SAM protein [Candidatus Magnetomorum sp.]|nr:B12-binding domain-containing radical SAM protein [Candidatus Magnetomorum sp.]
MDILLVQPPIHDFYLTQKRTIPYGLACMASALKAEGFETKIFDALSTHKSKQLPWPDTMMYLQEYYGQKDISPFALFHHYRHFGYSFQHIGKIARESGAFLIGISSLFTAYSEQALYTAQIIKSWQPNCVVVMGGHHPTHFPKQVLNHPAVDYVIRGEGELSMPLLAKALKNNTPVDDIPGIAFKRSESDFFIRSLSLVNDLDQLPLPDISDIHRRFYCRNGQRGLVVTASRGCPMTCSYCAMGDKQYTYRKKSVGRVIEEISVAMGDASSAFIDFEDENISLDRRWFMKLLEQIILKFSDRNLEIRAMNGLYPASLDTEMIHAMKQAGFNALNLSVGTFSQKQLARFHRVNVYDKLPGILNTAKEIGLATTAYIIAGGAHQDPFESVNDLLTLFHMGTVVGLSIFYPAPASQDYFTLEHHHLLPEDFSLMRATAIPISHTTSRLQSITLLRLTRIINFIQALPKKHLPALSPCKTSVMPLEDRQKIGEQLLSWFFYDGKIRGIEADGAIYHHKTDASLIDYFLKIF